jgi:predicted neutral ceramidase superfamily lipid hydrolase
MDMSFMLFLGCFWQGGSRRFSSVLADSSVSYRLLGCGWSLALVKTCVFLFRNEIGGYPLRQKKLTAAIIIVVVVILPCTVLSLLGFARWYGGTDY